MSAHRDLTRGDDHLRIAPWRGDATTAHLTPARGRLSTAAVGRSIATLGGTGYRAAVTSALGPADAAPFLEAGFSVHERLHVLRSGLDPAPPAMERVPIRRGRRSDRSHVLALDAAAFSPFWTLDGPGLVDALQATPTSRLRVIDLPGGESGVAAYSVTGRAGSRGYLQRLAVRPSQQRRGLGSAMVTDAVRWLRRWGAREILVNTQEHNHAALALYEAMGFRRQTEGLTVLWRSIDEGSG
ncbi:MAG: GNAT family N-acetyltransferase [Acidimicrobiales bacterium]